MGAWIRVARVDEIPPGTSRRVKAGKWEIALFHADGTFVAVKDACPHQQVSLAGGPLEGLVLTCPGHVWKFDLSDGHCLEGDPEVTLMRFPVSQRGGDLFVEV